MEDKIEEINVIVGDEAESKSMYESKENMSTESANRSDSGTVSYTHLSPIIILS